MFKVKVTELSNIVIITKFPITKFKQDLYKKYKSSRVAKFFYSNFTIFGKGTIQISKALLPEMIYLLTQLSSRKYNHIINKILEKTWMQSTMKEFPNRIKSSNFSDFNYNLKPYQKEFIQMYDNRKQKYRLNGYVLAFEQGLGKTFTSIALMHGLRKNAVIIIAPKSTLKTVWKNEINTVFKTKKNIWVIGDTPKVADYYIVNYESINKLSNIVKFLLNKNVGIIVDESHNFTNVAAKRVINLKSISKITKCEDILLMSGTPIRALGKEMIPTLELLDPYFDDLAQKVFLAAFGVSVPIALDILKNRLGLIMHRKMKVEVAKLPKKERTNIKIKIKNGQKYTLDNVKKQIQDFILERQKYYKKNKKIYEEYYMEAIDYLKNELSKNKDFKKYLEVIKTLKKYGYDARNKDLVNKVAWANKYEKEIMRPILPPEIRRRFDQSKAVVKYVNLKIMGEVLGGLLNRLRSEMFSEMVKSSPICKIIENSKKKTVCFSTFVDVVKLTNDYLISNCKFKPSMVFGETSSAILPILKNFKEDDTINPLIATIQTMSTGVTLVEANTVIFLNKPWRHTESAQAEDRVHRIGQDTDVHIYTFVLDTGNKNNLSTRMEDIVSWSREMFEGIVGTEKSIEFNKLFTKAFMKFFK